MEAVRVLGSFLVFMLSPLLIPLSAAIVGGLMDRLRALSNPPRRGTERPTAEQSAVS